jgi:acetaldehyde dehydrogenase (acetylating)
VSTPLVKDLVLLLVANRTSLGIPSTVRMDRLMETGDSISVAMRGTPKTLKEYINGHKLRSANFDVLAITSEGANDLQNLTAVSWLDAVGALFEGMKNFSLSATRTVSQATQVTMPTIVSRTESGRVSYVLNISIEYREEA